MGRRPGTTGEDGGLGRQVGRRGFPVALGDAVEEKGALALLSCEARRALELLPGLGVAGADGGLEGVGAEPLGMGAGERLGPRQDGVLPAVRNRGIVAVGKRAL
jgi:hypothetical protein